MKRPIWATQPSALVEGDDRAPGRDAGAEPSASAVR